MCKYNGVISSITLHKPMYKAQSNRQLAFDDFNQSCGMQLSLDDEWCVLANRIDWKTVESLYSANFRSGKGHPAASARQALGALVIQKRTGLSDRALVKSIAENPYYQYFIGMPSYSKHCPFTYSTLAGFRKRITVELLQVVNDAFLKDAPPTREHNKDKRSNGDKADLPCADNVGTMILDATCSPSNIRYPQDFSLLNEAREKTDSMIDVLHRQVNVKGVRHPRTYREVLHKAYLAVAKAKKRPAKKVRALVRKLLCALLRNLGFIDALLAHGGKLSVRQAVQLETIRQLYAQQKEMFDAGTHRVEKRIVSIEQPHVRPVVRGKAKSPVEFGAKYDVSIDEKGHARLEKISFEPYNECGVFKDAVERYKERTGHYPKRVLVDQIYRTRENRAFCGEHGISMSGRGPGRPPKDEGQRRRAEARDEKDRIEVERFFSREKRTCGAALIATKLEQTSLASIALSVFVANLFGIPASGFFVLYFLDTQDAPWKWHFLEFLESDD